MNENIDLTKILADCPEGTKLFCTEFGYVEFSKISTDDYFPIVVKTKLGQDCYTKDGYSSTEEWRDEYAEPSLYPAHDQRDWSKFVPTWETKKDVVKVTLHPFDKVLARCEGDGKWEATLITDFDNTDKEMPYLGLRYWYGYCIPYNKDTAHLLGTSDKPEVDYEIEFSKEFKEQ